MIELQPFYSEKIWGYEKWNVSTHRNGQSIVVQTGEVLRDYLQTDLPILVKIIQANETLSVQVHPDNDYAQKYENDNGKTECWYILEASEGAGVICGLETGMDQARFKHLLTTNQVEQGLRRISVKAGDLVYIPAGTVHAIEGGLKILEVQQSSDVTYRLYDWGREREMHLEKGMAVIDFMSQGSVYSPFKQLETPYFQLKKRVIQNEEVKNNRDIIYFCLDGNLTCRKKQQTITLEPDQTLF
ncbi:MAG: type I phosphomannose isomerase catalytic subunit, partial [Culicoidibacterales bacterium]